MLYVKPYIWVKICFKESFKLLESDKKRQLCNTCFKIFLID